jgi:Na+/melibiose symporter-like transporter
LFDTLHTLFFVNFQSLFPDKFRSVKERRTATGVQIFLGVIGIAIGSILPPLIYKYGDLTSYIVQALVVCFITIISFVFAIPGFREDPMLVDQYLKSVHEVSSRPSFVNTTKRAFKQKAFVAYMILYTMYWVIINSMQSSLPYVTRYILGMPASATTLIMAGLLIGIMCSIPLWVKLSHKINDNRKIMLIGAVLMGFYAIPLIFLDSYILIIINVIIWGTAQGAYWVMIFPVFADVIDESVVLHKKREEGTYIGIQQFFGRIGLIIQILSFTIIHELTGFVEGADIQSPLAIWGIHMHLALIPMIAILLGAFAFWRLFDLKPDKVIEHQQLIRTLKL